MLNIDIDTGGTMTDGLVSGDGQVISLKVETTPHDVTIAFVDILDAAKDALGLADLRTLLEQVEVVRWSSTITSNVLAQRVGPQIGLLVSAGHEADLYDEDAAATVLGSLVSAEDITGIAADADEATVRQAIKALLDKGIRRINVSLAGVLALALEHLQQPHPHPVGRGRPGPHVDDHVRLGAQAEGREHLDDVGVEREVLPDPHRRQVHALLEPGRRRQRHTARLDGRALPAPMWVRIGVERGEGAVRQEIRRHGVGL